MDLALAGDGTHALELVGDPDRGATRLEVVPAADPEIAVPLSSEPVSGVENQVFARFGACPRRQLARPYQPHETHLEVFDIGPPLRRRGASRSPSRSAPCTTRTRERWGSAPPWWGSPR